MSQLVPIQIRRDTAANWTSTNPVLLSGEMGIETDTRKSKFGDGTTAWASLAYATDPTAAIPASQKAAVNGVASLDGTGKVPSAQLPSSASVPASATPLPLAATAALGTSSKYMREDAVFPLPSINAIGGLPQSSGNYNASTNTVLTGPYAGQNLVSGTLPTGTSTAPTGFKVTVAGSPGVDSLGALSGGDEVFYSSALVWDVMGGAAQTTNLYKGDGTTSGRLVAAVPGVDYNPGPLFQTGIPMLMLPSGTVASGGLFTISGTNTPPAYPQGCYAYVSANALYSGSPAGWVWGVLAGSAGGTATSIQLYNNYISASGTTAQLAGTSVGANVANGYAAPASPTTSGITGGTHTQPTATNIYAPGPTLVGGYMGNNGRALAEYSVRVNGNTANIKSFQPGALWSQLNPTTSNYTNVMMTSINNGSQGHQNSTFNDISAGGTQSYITYDSSTTQVLNPHFNMAVGGSGNDFASCEALIMMIVPRA